MEGSRESDLEKEEDDDTTEISQPVMVCITDLAFKFTGAWRCELPYEQLAKKLELFSQHAGGKSANMEDVILCAHRNELLASSLRSFCNELKGEEPQTERKWKKASRKNDKASSASLWMFSSGDYIAGEFDRLNLLVISFLVDGKLSSVSALSRLRGQRTAFTI
ncbi:hypothetical protein NE237_007389 [Protea cynaroides]|uniref:Uncharacterized protein n=1 Tax=Protea cynaroides TaxID=273540 RepID=A0A9Q0QW26_9MAGN|nr:hypothetical protein NE237_007389 [Protea cynaroides]